VIRAVLFDLGSTLLEFENHPWEELIRQGVEAVYDALHAHGAGLPGRDLFCRALHDTYSTTWRDAEQALVEMEIRLLLEKTGLVGLRKPHPQTFQTALEALQVVPHEAVFVGDRFPEDVAGAKHIGMRGVWQERPDRERLPDVIPDAQIVNLRELLDWLDLWTERHSA
jgi:FMN phosphatase YigB (HAD superfamily)